MHNLEVEEAAKLVCFHFTSTFFVFLQAKFSKKAKGQQKESIEYKVMHKSSEKTLTVVGESRNEINDSQSGEISEVTAKQKSLGGQNPQ